MRIMSITIEEGLYRELKKTAGPRRMSRFISHALKERLRSGRLRAGPPAEPTGCGGDQSAYDEREPTASGRFRRLCMGHGAAVWLLGRAGVGGAALATGGHHSAQSCSTNLNSSS